MSEEPFFICSDCGSDVLALSHTWENHRDFEEVGTVGPDGGYVFEEKVVLEERDTNDEWIAYCGGCGEGITVEWLSGNRVRVLLQAGEASKK